MSTMKRIVLIVLLLLVLVALLSTYVAVQIVDDLRAARATLTGATSDLTDEDLEATVRHLEEVSNVLDGVAARPLGLVPVLGQNIRALDAVVDTAIPALRDAQTLYSVIDEAESSGLLRNGKVLIGRLDPLRAPLARQTASFRELRDTLEEHRNGWLLPPMWDALNTLFNKTQDLQRSADRTLQAVGLASAMLGAEEDRTYLVLLLNNAELRGAGGILSGVGTLTISDGRFELGRFDYYADLSDGERKKVDAPEDLSRRFGRYWADTTLWVNTSASPDVPEVAITARNLYEVAMGVRTDGAIIVDARGLEAMTPEDATVRVPGTEIELTQPKLAEFMYSDSYEVLSEADQERRETILSLGPRILELFLKQDIRRQALQRLHDAISGQHLRIISFNEDENSTLASLDLSGELTSDAIDTSLFTVQNLGADKLDYWMDREVEHGCRVSDGGLSRCQTRITLRNRTPKGLPSYVTQDKKPYGLYKGYLETYIPEGASVTGYTIDGEEPEYFTEVEDARQSLGAYFDTRRGKSTRVDVTYDLAIPEDRYTLEVSPQPLARDATVRVVISAPDDWVVETPDGRSRSAVEFKGTLDGTLRFSAAPEERPGLTGLWDRMVRFWNNPVF